MVDLNDTLLNELVSLLKPFDTATKCLSTDKSATLHLVIATKVQLSKHLTPTASDSAILSQLKQHLHNQLERYFTIYPLHYTATLLDPRLKNNLSLISHQQHATAVDGPKQMMSTMSAHLPVIIICITSKEEAKTSRQFLRRSLHHSVNI